MSDELGIVKVSNITAIADAIKEESGDNTNLKISQMPDAIHGIKKFQDKIASTNGLIVPDAGYNGLSRVYVMVPAASVTDVAFLRVHNYITSIENIVVSKDFTNYEPVHVEDHLAIYSLSEVGEYTITFDSETRTVNIQTLYDVYDAYDAPPFFLDGCYWVSYDKGDYATWGSRKFTRTLASGQPLLWGAAKNRSGYICPAIASANDLGAVGNVISGDYVTLRQGQFEDGSPIYCYGAMNGAFTGTDVKIYKANGTLMLSLPFNEYKVSLPYPTSNPNVYSRTSEFDSLISVVETAIRYYSPQL